MVTVLTPTYNRVTHLQRLFVSLCRQTRTNFQWLVIDDGSKDGTEEWFYNLPDTNFRKDFYKKENGGKHTALNYAHPYIKGEIVIIVDSDDYLIDPAIEIIEADWNKYKDDITICGITYLRGIDENTPLGNALFPINGEINSSISIKINGKINVDSCEVVRTDVLKEFPFPVTQGEKFIGETYLWNLSGLKYKMVYLNKILYITEYLEGGLTKSGRSLRIQCPYGGMYNSKTYFFKEVCFKQRVKNIWLFICYGKFAGLNYHQIQKKSGLKYEIMLNYIFGYLLYKYWNIRYSKS